MDKRADPERCRHPSSPSFGVRIKFSELETAERETLRQFLKFVESATQKYHNSNNYLAELKR